TFHGELLDRSLGGWRPDDRLIVESVLQSLEPTDARMLRRAWTKLLSATLLRPTRRRCAAVDRLPARRQLAQNVDRMVLDGEIAAGDEVLHQLSDHVARRPDAIGDLLLCQPLGNRHSPVDLDRQRIDETHEPAIDVRQREALQVARGDADAMDQLLDQVHREIRVREDEITQLRAVHDGAHRLLDRHHRCRARRPVEAHLADVAARPLEIDDELAPGLVAREDLDPPREDDVEGIADIALVDEDRVAWKAAHDARRGDAAQRLVLQRSEQVGAWIGSRHGVSWRANPVNPSTRPRLLELAQV